VRRVSRRQVHQLINVGFVYSVRGTLQETWTITELGSVGALIWQRRSCYVVQITRTRLVLAHSKLALKEPRVPRSLIRYSTQDLLT
jgi:hypothetical protein